MPSISTLNRWARLKSPWVLVLPVRLWRVHFTGMLLLQASAPIEGLVHCDPDRGSGASLLILAADPRRRARGPEIGPSGFRPPPRTYLACPAIWPMRKMTNSAGFTGAMPISQTIWPASTTSGGLVSASHLT